MPTQGFSRQPTLISAVRPHQPRVLRPSGGNGERARTSRNARGGAVRAMVWLLGGLFSLATLAILAVPLLLYMLVSTYTQDLPDAGTLSAHEPPTISRIYSAEGRVIDEFAHERRLFAPIDEIPELVKAAFISAEDKNFHLHAGYDPRGMAIALRDALASRGQVLRGASTITQQVMKILFFRGDYSVARKIREIILASRVEKILGKEQILEIYLNEIFLGQRSYGVAAASQTYFNKSLDDLTPHEAAFLASLPKAPSQLHPVRNQERLRERRNFVLKEMMENGYITGEVFQTESALPIRSVQNGDFPPFNDTLPPRDYFTDEIRRQLSEAMGNKAFHTAGLSVRATIDQHLQGVAAQALRRRLETYDRAQGRWRGTGKTIDADMLVAPGQWREALRQIKIPRDIDLDGQWYPAVALKVARNEIELGIENAGIAGSTASETLKKALIAAQGASGEDVPKDVGHPVYTPNGTYLLGKGDIDWLQGDFTNHLKAGDVVHVRRLLDPETGRFLRWSLRQIPEVQGAFMAMDVDSGRVLAMQGGFSYAASRFNRATQARRQPGSSFKPFVYAAALDQGYTPATVIVDAPIEFATPQGIWRPANYSDRFYGPQPLRTGIEQSRNLMTVRLANVVGIEKIGEYARNFGVYDRFPPLLANALGARETTLFRMVAAFAMFANGGERVEPTLVDRVQDRRGKTLYRHESRVCLDCDLAELPEGMGPHIVSFRERVMDPVTAYQLTTMMRGAVERGTGKRWIDLPVPVAGKTGTTNDSRDTWFIGYTSNIVAGCYIGHDQPRSMGRASFGGSMCGPVFQEFMDAAINQYGGGEFRAPEGCRFIPIDRSTGARLARDAEGEHVSRECFRRDTTPVFGEIHDGGFAMGSDFERMGLANDPAEGRTPPPETTPGRASAGRLSAGGLY